MAGVCAILSLVAISYTKDAYQREVRTETEVFAEELPVFSAAFNAASANGYELRHIFRMHAYEYEGEKLVVYEGQEYDVYQRKPIDDDWVELHLTTKKRG